MRKTAATRLLFSKIVSEDEGTEKLIPLVLGMLQDESKKTHRAIVGALMHWAAFCDTPKGAVRKARPRKGFVVPGSARARATYCTGIAG